MGHCVLRTTLFLITLKYLFSLRTLEAWNDIFRSNTISGKLTTESFLHDRLERYVSQLQSRVKYPFVVKYPENCGHQCHDLIEAQLQGIGRHNHYSIIGAEHALIYTDHATLLSLQSSHKSLMLDFIPFLPELKLDKDVDVQSICAAQSEMAINVVFLPSDSREVDELKATLSQFPYPIQYSEVDANAIQPHQENLLTLHFSCDDAPSILSTISERSDVQWIERYLPSHLQLRYANGVSQSGKSKTPLFHANLTGNGQIIGIADSGIDPTSCFFKDVNEPFPYGNISTTHRKLVIYITDTGTDIDETGHGTGVAGSASGKCNDPKHKYSDYYGSAYNSKVAFMDLAVSGESSVLPPGNYYTGIFQRLYDAGSKIQTLSFGSESSSYTTQARYVDQFMWDNKDSLIFVAAGNSGSKGSGTVGTPATNKNGVSVGASYNDEEAWNANGKVSSKTSQLTKANLADFSSRGPTADSRLKPDVCAVGEFISSITLLPHFFPPPVGTNLGTAVFQQDCSISIVQGTSFSSPLMAGYAALVRQYFLEGFYPTGFRNASNSFSPSGALIKAILVNSAEGLDYINDGDKSTTTKKGDNNQGYGRIQLSNSLSFNVPATVKGLTMFVKGSSVPSSKHYVELTATNEQHVYNFTTTVDPLTDIRVWISLSLSPQLIRIPFPLR
jgi:hypothetical protein